MAHARPVKNDTLRALGHLTELAALLHDLGKTTSGFQTKLTLALSLLRPDASLISDPVRHEVISTLIAKAFLRACHEQGASLSHDPKAIGDWFRDHIPDVLSQFLPYYKRIQDSVDKIKDSSSLKKLDVSSIVDPPFGLKTMESDTESASLLWLILTHHRLPRVEVTHSGFAPACEKDLKKLPPSQRKKAQSEGTNGSLSLSLSLSAYINPKTVDRLDAFFTIDDPDQCGHPWNDECWCARVARLMGCIERDRDAIPSVSFDQPSAWAYALIYQARSALLMGDHYGSSCKTASLAPGVADSTCAYANTDRIGPGKTPVFADTVADHSLKVAFETARYFHVLYRKDHDPIKNLDSIEPSLISKSLTSNRSPAPFDWQNHLNDVAKSLGDAPSLSIVMAKTGTGKTRGCIKLAQALSGSKGLRCTLALGLRTLASQAYEDYTSHPINLPSSKVGRMIGRYYPVNEQQEGSIGSSITEDDGDRLLSFDDQRNEWHEIKATGLFRKGRHARLFSAPVQTMTIDHIIGAATPHKSTDTQILMHLMHSDLIIDEIDNFSPTDLSFVTTLVHLMGFFARNVILATATMNEVLVRAMSDAFQAGVIKRQEMGNDTPSARVALIQSDAPFYSICDQPDRIASAYRALMAENERPSQGASRHYPRLLPIESPEQGALGVFRQMAQSISQLCRDHFETIGGLAYSTGFIRFSRVQDAQSAAQYLAKHFEDDQTHLELVCYHAKTTAFERYIQEYFLNHLMKRKGGSYPESVQRLRDGLFERARKAGKARVVLCVVTTPVIEVGRDHCYDWCVLEPASLSSYIQSIGRVLRHRYDRVAETPNIHVLDRPLRSLQGKPSPWSFPGIETPDPSAFEGKRGGYYQLMKTPVAGMAEKARSLGMALSDERNSNRVTLADEMLGKALLSPSNRYVLETPRHYSDLPEHSLNLIRLGDYLIAGNTPAGRTQAKIINAGNIIHQSGYQMALSLGQRVRFRHSEGQVSIICQTLDGDYQCPWIHAQTGQPLANIRLMAMEASAFLLSFVNRDEFISHYMARFGNLSRQAIQANLFQLTLYPYELESASGIAFNRHLGALTQ